MDSITAALSVSAVAAAVIYVVQGKGFSYHGYPLSALAVMALFSLVSGSGDVLKSLRRDPLAVPSLLVAAFVCFGYGSFAPSMPARRRVTWWPCRLEA